MESWAEFKARNPYGLVMAQPVTNRYYGRNPYTGYVSLQRPFLYSGEEPPHNIPSLARVVRLGAQAWPVTRLREDGITLTWSLGRPLRWTPLILGRGAMGDDTRA
jgi:hypothetical protein